ncbi:MAG: M1 family aminopeptidase [candidate division KSB1 bacterium]|nr:M1 family aminopeptidase [candidate division KSB1 bacterium]
MTTRCLQSCLVAWVGITPAVLSAQTAPLAVYELERRPVRTEFEQPAFSWDVLRYVLRLAVDRDQEQIHGDLQLTAVCRDAGTPSLRLDLVALRADSALVDDVQVGIRQGSRQLEIALPRAASAGDTVRVRIFYHGRPTNDGFGGFFFSPKAVFTVGEGIYSYPPSMTHTWVACQDHPSDKALFELIATVPAPWTVASNGLLAQTFVRDQLATYHWRSRYPMAPYLFALAASLYDTLRQDLILATGDTLPIVHFVYPEAKEAARKDFQNLPLALTVFARLFGPYPFEKYGSAMVPCRGAMEHQTLTTLSDALVDGSRRYERVFVHELAHQWWGDLVTLQEWADLWLNEGFASYAEVLFVESLYGRPAAQSILREFASRYFAEEKRLGPFAVYNPPAAYMWGATVYDKGAWVLHMLRFLVGDSAFFRILQRYRERFAFGNAATRDFQAVAEEVSGLPLDSFFDQWLYRSGHPILAVTWWQKMPGQLTVEITQLQDGPLFALPVEIETRGKDWRQRDTLWTRSVSDTFALRLRVPLANSWAESLEVDPDNWLLKELRVVPLPGQEALRLNPAFPNPMRSTTTVSFQYGRNAPGHISLAICNVRGQRIRTLFEGWYYGGGETFTWDRGDDEGQAVPSGLYLVVFRCGNLIRSQKLVVLP